MNVLVTYWSQTGNTRKIAQTIFDAINCNKELKTFEDVESLDGFDLAFIGFPIMQFGPAKSAMTFIKSHAEGQNIALFVTHAMPTESKDPRQQTMLENELEKCRQICTHAKLLGMYHCQGELSEPLAHELKDSEIPMLMEFAGMQPSTKGHPSREEVEMAKEFAKEMIMKI